MSLFDDDFYSTKVSKWSRDGKRWFSIPRRREKQLGSVLFLLLCGMILTLAVQGIFGSEAKPAINPNLNLTDANVNDPVVGIVERVMPTVVSIISTSQGENSTGGISSVGIGSGVIYQLDGKKARIVTNYHVVQNASHIQVILASGEQKKAQVIGKDMITDLAVVEVEAEGIKQTAEFGDSERLKPGETAIAIGNPLGLGFSQSITKGVISWPKRRIPVSIGGGGSYDWEYDVIQTDAAINQGNSGGALVNLSGKVVGINSMKISETGVEGLGFAIPINQVKATVDSLVLYGKVKRPYMGVTTVELNDHIEGVAELKLPSSVKNGLIVLETMGPAKEAGLQTNDVIIELDGKPIGSTLELRKYLYEQRKIGDNVKVTFYRGSKKMSVAVTLGESQKE